MPPPDLRVPIDVIRREAGLARDQTSLRAVAREVGMTPMGLRSFLQGDRKPQESTVRKVSLWYARRIGSRPEGEDHARVALTILGGQYPHADRARVVNNLLDVMERDFRTSRMEVPAWVDALRREVPITES